MPYKIKQFNDGFRVVSDKGTLLSKKPMTESNAHKQLVAVSMKNELCGAGGASGIRYAKAASAAKHDALNNSQIGPALSFLVPNLLPKKTYTNTGPTTVISSLGYDNKYDSNFIPTYNNNNIDYNAILDEYLPNRNPIKQTSNSMSSYMGLGYPHLNSDNYALHAVIFKKPIDKNSMIEQISHYIHKKEVPFIRETNTSYRVRNIPKTKFVKSSFRTKKINPKVSLVYGELINHLQGGFVKIKDDGNFKKFYNSLSDRLIMLSNLTDIERRNLPFNDARRWTKDDEFQLNEINRYIIANKRPEEKLEQPRKITIGEYPKEPKKPKEKPDLGEFKHDLAIMVRHLKEYSNEMLPEEEKDKYLKDFNVYDLKKYDSQFDNPSDPFQFIERIPKPIKDILDRPKEAGEDKEITELRNIINKIKPPIRKLDKAFLEDEMHGKLTDRFGPTMLDKYPDDKQYQRQELRRMIYRDPILIYGFAIQYPWLYDDKELKDNGFIYDAKTKKWFNNDIEVQNRGLGKPRRRKGGSNVNISLLDFIRLVRKEGLGSFSYSDVMVNKTLLNKLDQLATNSGYNLILPVNKSYSSTTSAYNSYIKKRKGLGNFGSYLASLVGIRTEKLSEPSEIKKAYDKAVKYMIEAHNSGLNDTTDIWEYGYNKIKNDYPYVNLNDLAEVCQSAIDSVVAEIQRLIQGQIRNEEQIQRDFELGEKQHKKAVKYDEKMRNRLNPKTQFKQNKFNRF